MPITKRTPIGDVVSDFEKSKAPQFKGKSKTKRREMAVAAALSKKDNKNMTKEELSPAEANAKKSAIALAQELMRDAQAALTAAKTPLQKKAAQDNLILAKEKLAQANAIKEEKYNTGMTKEKLKELAKEIFYETTSTSKYDNDPALKGGQTKLPDSLQAGIIKAAKKRGVKSEAVAYFKNPETGKFEREDTGKVDPTQVSLNKLLQRFKSEDEKYDLGEDLDIGHQDNEPKMLVADLYRIAKYATELGQMVAELGKLEGEVDFPHWWQSEIIKAKECMVSAKHYLDGELKTGQAFD